VEEYYVIYCKTDGQCYQEFDTLAKAEGRAKFLAEKNINREYVVLKNIKSFEAIPMAFDMVER